MIIDAFDVQFHQVPSQIIAPVWEGIAGFVDERPPALAGARPGHLGGPRRPEAFHGVEGDVLGGGARGADLADERGDAERAKRWRAGADEIKAEILDKGLSERGVFRQHYETDELDASLLLLPIMGSCRRTTSASGPPCWPSPTS